MTSSTPADYTALTVLGTVTPRAVTIVDTTQSAADDDITVDQPEVAEDGEELIDYNEIEEEQAREREAKRESLREQIAATGQGMRRMLVNEPIRSYFASPLAMEEMSIEDIMREIPSEDLQYVGSVKDRVYMPVSFVQKWVLASHYQSAKGTQGVPRWEITRWNGTRIPCLHLRPIGHGLQQARQHKPS